MKDKAQKLIEILIEIIRKISRAEKISSSQNDDICVFYMDATIVNGKWQLSAE